MAALATPVGDQLARVLAQLNGGAAALIEADAAARFAPVAGPRSRLPAAPRAGCDRSVPPGRRPACFW